VRREVGFPTRVRKTGHCLEWRPWVQHHLRTHIRSAQEALNTQRASKVSSGARYSSALVTRLRLGGSSFGRRPPDFAPGRATLANILEWRRAETMNDMIQELSIVQPRW